METCFVRGRRRVVKIFVAQGKNADGRTCAKDIESGETDVSVEMCVVPAVCRGSVTQPQRVARRRTGLARRLARRWTRQHSTHPQVLDRFGFQRGFGVRLPDDPLLLRPLLSLRQLLPRERVALRRGEHASGSRDGHPGCGAWDAAGKGTSHAHTHPKLQCALVRALSGGKGFRRDFMRGEKKNLRCTHNTRV